jgi:hypothetical protein
MRHETGEYGMGHTGMRRGQKRIGHETEVKCGRGINTRVIRWKHRRRIPAEKFYVEAFT